MPDPRAGDKHFIRNGVLCYRYNVTFTFREPKTLKGGLYDMSYSLKGQKHIRDIVLYPEYGDQGNFHLHGTIWSTNKVYFWSFINHCRKVHGFVKIQKQYKTSNQVLWHLYCRKDQWQYKGIIRYPRINKKNIIPILKRWGFQNQY